MSDLLNSASLVMIPSGYKEDIVYSEIPIDGSGDLQFTRSSNGTRVNSAGLVEVTPWNLGQYSEDFSNGVWVKTNTTVSTNTTTAPNGTTTADSLLETTANATHQLWQRPEMVAGQTFTQSCYIKTNGRNRVQLQIFDSSALYVSALFDVVSGTIIATNGTSSIESVGNGWYRCIVSGVCPTSTTGYCVINLATDSFTQASAQDSYTGDASKGIFIWGAQLNIGSTAKPYFPTTDRLNVPRLTYQNGGGGCPSLLLEKQSTNLVSYSEQFDNAAWTSASATVSANSTTSPDGTQNADLIYPSSSGSNLGLYQFNAGVVAVVGTISCYVKSAGKNWALLGTDNTSAYNVSFDLANGVVGSVPTGYTATITSVGNGWYRITATFQSGFSIAYPFVGVADNTNRSVTASGTNGIYIWGFQAEVSSYPTSYIPTTSSSATRVADLTSVPQGTIANFGTGAFCVFLDVNYAKLSVGGAVALLGNRQTGNWWRIYSNGSDFYFEVQGSNGYSQISLINSGSLTSRTKIAINRNGNVITVYVNGSSVNSSTNIVWSSDFTTGNSSVEFNAWGAGAYEITTTEYNEAVFFKQSLTATELASLTTI